MVKSKNDVDKDVSQVSSECEGSCSVLQLLQDYNLDFLLQEIFLCLDFVSLHAVRQVSKEWNEFILSRIWSSKRGWRRMRHKLERQWKEESPHKKEFNLNKRGFYLAVDDLDIGMGTLDNEATLMNMHTGLEMITLECQERELVHSAVFNNLNQGNFISEALSIQLDLTDQVIVTVTGCGVVTIWDRKTGDNLYRGAHHGYEPVLGVRAIGDMVVTGGINGSLAILSLQENYSKVKLECMVSDTNQSSINHLDSDGTRVLVGTDRDMRLWQVGDSRSRPYVEASVPAEHVCCCVLFYPHAACTGLFASYGVQIWDMVNKVLIRHLHTELSMWVVQVKNNILATSMSGEMNDSNTPSIFLHDINQLVDTDRYPDKDLWFRRIMCTREDLTDPHIAINTTCLFAVTRFGTTGAKVTCWDFWSYSQPVTWDTSTFLQTIDDCCFSKSIFV